MKKGKVTYHGLRPVSEAASTKMASIVFGKNLEIPSTKDNWLSSKSVVADKEVEKSELLPSTNIES
jgi:hypothetical protein